jgi:hypothetical protein
MMAVAVAAAGFGVQAAGLRRAPRANVVAARAADWLLRYRSSTSTFRLGGRTVHGLCRHGWFEGAHERFARGTLLVFDNGASVRALPPRTLLRHGLPRLRSITALDLAGCTHVLGPRIATLAQFDNDVELSRALVRGQPAFALRFERMTLLVSARTGRPLGVRLDGVASRIQLGT